MTRQEIMLNEYKNRFEVADKVLSETRAKLTKAEHDRDRYKAEIERLKAQQREIEHLKDDYAKLQGLFAQYQMASDKEIRAQVKQAKIDVLNELKEKRTTVFIDIDEVDEAVFIDDINGLIKELK